MVLLLVAALLAAQEDDPYPEEVVEEFPIHLPPVSERVPTPTLPPVSARTMGGAVV